MRSSKLNIVCPLRNTDFNKDCDLAELYLKKKVIKLTEKKSDVRGCDVTLKILDYCNKNEGKFLYINDDFIIDNVPKEPIYKGKLADNTNYNNLYRLATINTIEFLESENKPIKNFETHTPIIIDCKLFRELFNQLDFGNHNHFMKSIYLNWYEIEGIEGENVKLKDWSIQKAEYYFKKYGCISLSDNTPNSAYIYLRNRLTTPQP
jgi:hypothetical protein